MVPYRNAGSVYRVIEGSVMILYILVILMIIGAIAAIQMKDLISSIIAVGAVGLALSLAFLVLT